MVQSVALIVEHTWIVAELAEKHSARVQNKDLNTELELEGVRGKDTMNCPDPVYLVAWG